MKLGVITDGISRDLSHALGVMDEFGLDGAELQFVWDNEIGDHDAAEIARIKELTDRHGKTVTCLSRHVLAGLPMATAPGAPEHQAHLDALKRVIDAAFALAGPDGPPLVRIMSGRKETILFGRHGAEKWNVAKGAWDALLPLVAPAVEIARAAGVQLVVETGNGTMVNSCWTGRKLIDDLDARDVLRVLWDPANNCWAHEAAWPDGYETLDGAAGGYLGHIHIKDVQVDTPKATLEVRPMGEGQLKDQYPPLGAALKRDGYAGWVSFESVYHPGDGDFEAGFRRCIGPFKAVFG